MTQERYRVIERLEAGGMAEVFLGEVTSVQGFKKRVAIKRVLPHLAQQKNFIGMFLDEARLGAQLNHANIVSVIDIGASEDTFFLVMEFIDGTNLRKLTEAFQKRNYRVPLKEAVYIAIEVCRGLAHAHELRDDERRPMGLVHRDVSPPNILLSRAGEVKVTDFGLAKARTQLEKTDPGVVKGKFSYLSPEAVRGLEVDKRADIFSLGAVLWEMLAGRKLFEGRSDYETVQKIMQVEVSSLIGKHPDMDAAFQDILFKALAGERDQRYQSAREFSDALAGYLFERKLKVTSYDVAALVSRAQDTMPSLPPPSTSIDEMIQDELNHFRSLGYTDRPATGTKIRTTKDANTKLEDPDTWFNMDSEVNSAVAQATSIPAAPAHEWFDDEEITKQGVVPPTAAIPRELTPTAVSGNPPSSLPVHTSRRTEPLLITDSAIEEIKPISGMKDSRAVQPAKRFDFATLVIVLLLIFGLGVLGLLYWVLA